MSYFPNRREHGEGAFMCAAEKYHPVDCDLHDYLEIACLYHYLLRIELTTGNTLMRGRDDMYHSRQRGILACGVP